MEAAPIPEQDPTSTSSVIIESGSGFIKAGFSGEENPRFISPMMIGRPKKPNPELKTCYCGDAVNDKRGLLKIEKPIEKGQITNWDNIETIWSDTFYSQLRKVPEETLTLAICSPANPLPNKEKMTAIFFETFNVPGLYIIDECIAALYAKGKTTGVILSVGEQVSSVVPVHEGHSLASQANVNADIGGQYLTDYLVKILTESGYSFTDNADLLVVEDIKQKLGYVALDFEEEMANSVHAESPLEMQYKLPDGKVINIGNQRFRCPEALFKPQLIGIEIDPLHQQVYKSIYKCDQDLRNDFYKNIILAGGTMLFKGMADRLIKEITALAPSSAKVNAINASEYQSWVGGSIFSLVGEKFYVSKSEYEELGPKLTVRKYE